MQLGMTELAEGHLIESRVLVVVADESMFLDVVSPGSTRRISQLALGRRRTPRTSARSTAESEDTNESVQIRDWRKRSLTADHLEEDR